MGYLNQFPNTHYYDEDIGFLIKAYKDLMDKYNDLLDIYNFIKNNIRDITINYLNEMLENGEITLDTRYFEDEERLKFIFDKNTTKTLFQYAVTRFQQDTEQYSQLIGDTVKDIVFSQNGGTIELFEPLQSLANIKVSFPSSQGWYTKITAFELDENNYIKKVKYEVYNTEGIVDMRMQQEVGYIELIVGGVL